MMPFPVYSCSEDCSVYRTLPFYYITYLIIVYSSILFKSQNTSFYCGSQIIKYDYCTNNILFNVVFMVTLELY
jgi:hypothetical protein